MINIPTLIRTVQYIAILILVFELIITLAQRPSELQKHVTILIVATILMFIGYNIELDAVNLEEALAGTAVSYIGKPFVMLFSLTFICTFYEIKIPNKLFIPAVLYCSLFCILVFWNQDLHLYYSSVEFNIHDRYSPLVTYRGPLYYLYMATIVIFFILCVVAVVFGTKRTKSIEKLKLSNWIILMMLCGIAGYAYFLFGETNGYDSTMLGVFGSVVCLFWLFIKYRIFDTVTLAQEKAINESKIGLIVLDSLDELIYSNQIAAKLLEEIDVEKIMALRNETSNLHLKNKVYEVRKRDIVVDGTYYGKSIEISDITISYNYQSMLEHDVKERTAQIEDMQRELVGSIASIVEARSVETGEHIKRTKEYVELTAKVLKEKGKYTNILTDKYINLLVNATPLHDIGKISISDVILNKPGALNDEEYEKMKLHSTYGAKIIESSMRGLESDDYVALAEEIALHHHEWWDGSGYPDGLKGEDIPLAARIVAIADTYDALINERCYKKAYPKEKAISIIKEESGTHFDPNIVEAFLSEYDK